MGQDGREARESLQEFEEEARKEVSEARERVSSLQAQHKEALDRAFESRPRAAKRAWGDDEPKASDVNMEEEQVATLDPVQTVQFYRERIREEKTRLERVEQAAKKEKIPVQMQGPLQEGISSSSSSSSRRGTGKGLGATKQIEGIKEAGRSHAKEGAGQNAATTSPSSSSSISSMSQSSPIEVDEERVKDAKKPCREPQPSIDAQLQILMQERMQKQQELERLTEISRMQKMAVVRKVAREFNCKHRAVPY